MADAVHGHTADGAAVSQVHALTAGDALHGHLADGATLTQLHQLAAADALHAHAADQATFPGLVAPARGRLRLRSTSASALIVR